MSELRNLWTVIFTELLTCWIGHLYGDGRLVSALPAEPAVFWLLPNLKVLDAGGCLEGVWKVSGGFLRVSGRCPSLSLVQLSPSLFSVLFFVWVVPLQNIYFPKWMGTTVVAGVLHNEHSRFILKYSTRQLLQWTCPHPSADTCCTMKMQRRQIGQIFSVIFSMMLMSETLTHIEY